MKEIIIMSIAIIIFGAGILSVVLGLIYLKTGLFKFFYHDILGWHQPTEDVYLEPMSITPKSVCKYCGMEIEQDSQGNWY